MVSVGRGRWPAGGGRSGRARRSGPGEPSQRPAIGPLVRWHTRVKFLDLARQPGYLVPTVALPVLLYLFEGLPLSHGPRAGADVVVALAVFCTLEVVLVQFGAAVAQDRADPFEPYVRSLGAPPWVRAVAYIATALTFVVASLFPVVIVAAVTGHLGLGLPEGGELAALILLGSLPLAGVGLSIGYLVPGRGALAVSNLLWLGLTFLSRLLDPFQHLPAVLAGVSRVLPTTLLPQMAFRLVAGLPPRPAEVLGLLGWTVGTLLVAGLAYRRSTIRAYR